MATKKTVNAAEEPQEENQEVKAEEVKAEEVKTEVDTKEVNPEEIVLEPIVKEPVLKDADPEEEEDPKTFDDVYELLEDIDGKIDVIIRGL